MKGVYALFYKYIGQKLKYLKKIAEIMRIEMREQSKLPIQNQVKA